MIRRHLAIASFAVLASCAAEASPECGALDVPNPTDPVQVTAPAADLDPTLRALSGTWEGRWAGLRNARVTVESIDANHAEVVYAVAQWGPGGGTANAAVDRVTVPIETPGQLTLYEGGLRFELVGDELHGSYFEGKPGELAITMHRCPARDSRDVAPVATPPVASLPRSLQFAASFAFPILLALGVVRALRVPPRWLVYGAATWLLVSPALFALPILASLVFGGGDMQRMGLIWGITLSLTAGLFEESSRFVLYRNLRGMDTARFALVAGAAHGGIESIALGVPILLSPMPIVWAGVLSRPLFVIAHMGLSVLVWRAVSQKNANWLVMAIALHVAVDLMAFVLPALVPGTNGLVLVPAVTLAALAVWTFIRELREPA